MTEHATFPSSFVIADGLPLQRLYARFDAIAAGLTQGDSTAAHRSVIERLAANQRRAEALGWTAFVLERVGGSGRLELRGVPSPGQGRELVPDAIPHDGPEPTPESKPGIRLPRDRHGQIAGPLATVSWRSRMRWLDDGGH